MPQAIHRPTPNPNLGPIRLNQGLSLFGPSFGNATTAQRQLEALRAGSDARARLDAMDLYLLRGSDVPGKPVAYSYVQ